MHGVHQSERISAPRTPWAEWQSMKRSVNVCWIQLEQKKKQILLSFTHIAPAGSHSRGKHKVNYSRPSSRAALQLNKVKISTTKSDFKVESQSALLLATLRAIDVMLALSGVLVILLISRALIYRNISKNAQTLSSWCILTRLFSPCLVCCCPQVSCCVSDAIAAEWRRLWRKDDWF